MSRRALGSFSITVMLAGMICGGVPGRAGAHALLMGSTPAPGSTVAAPRRLVLRFNSRIERRLSSVHLVGPRGRTITRLDAAPGDAPEILVYRVPPLPPGTYQARWKVFSTDGHVTEGVLAFEVDASAIER